MPREYKTPPSEYLKKFYYDTVNFDVKALEFAISFAGADRLVAGSDYPHQIGSLEKMVSSIEQMHISAPDKADILGGNAASMLGL
jgi:aminocarboxymuconate-semialdehyde decarboxylase